MEFKTKLISGRLIRRYKRFLADVELDNGEEITAHCANPGAMTGLSVPGSKVWLSISDNPKRKLKYSWELVVAEGALQVAQRVAPQVGPQMSPLVGINTSHPNNIAAEAIEGGLIKELSGYGSLRREVKYGEKSRIDILLEDFDTNIVEDVVENVNLNIVEDVVENVKKKNAKPPCYVEVKSVTLMREAGLAEFPDTVTTRGARHLAELSNMVAEGSRAVMLYLIQRTDATSFSIAGDIDVKYGRAFEDVHQQGVEMLAYDCTITPEKIIIGRKIPVLSPRFDAPKM